jgi:hypothetical protein
VENMGNVVDEQWKSRCAAAWVSGRNLVWQNSFAGAGNAAGGIRN